MDSETGFLFSHAIASGVNKEQIDIIVSKYEEYQKTVKSLGKLLGALGNTDRAFCDVAFKKYDELENKMRGLLGDNFTKTIKSYRQKELLATEVKKLIESSEIDSYRLLELFPMFKEFI